MKAGVFLSPAQQYLFKNMNLDAIRWGLHTQHPPTTGCPSSLYMCTSSAGPDFEIPILPHPVSCFTKSGQEPHLTSICASQQRLGEAE